MKRLIILGLGAVLLTSAAPLRTAESQGPTADIVHKDRIITVPLMAVPAHLQHGDEFVCIPPFCD